MKNGSQGDDDARAETLLKQREAFTAAISGAAASAEAAAALVEVFEEVGEAVMESVGEGGNEDDQLDAGFAALDPHGDDNDALRVGIRWLVEACSSVEAPAPRRKKGKR